MVSWARAGSDADCQYDGRGTGEQRTAAQGSREELREHG